MNPQLPYHCSLNRRQVLSSVGMGFGSLALRGMLSDSTIAGEIDQANPLAPKLPKEGANKGTMTGRDHNHYGFTMWLAGGGVKGGYVHGATDEFGFKAVENRMHVHDLHASVLHLMGFDHERLTYRWAGRDFRLTDVQGKVVKDIMV